MDKRGYIYGVGLTADNEYHVVLDLVNEVFDKKYEIGDRIPLTEVRDAIDKLLNDPELYDKYANEP